MTLNTSCMVTYTYRNILPSLFEIKRTYRYIYRIQEKYLIDKL